ncbi:MAG: ABC transporter ATP-binding protein [Kurthia sp.]|nr:ABC transporter ATP-binding protein [Candidatus Kurthia equi]
MSLITIQSLSKKFGSHTVLDGVSLEIKEGQIFGLIGKNGAGKTTLMKIILGLLPADSGQVTVAGEVVRFGDTPTNRHIGYLPDVPAFYLYMTAFEYLCLCGEMAGLSKSERIVYAEKYLALVGLEKNKKRIGGFSRGMKQRLGIAQALIHQPKILICDEPTSALDPIGRKEMLAILQKIKNHTTVIFSTHILNDAQQICDEIALLHEGDFKLTGQVSEIMHAYEKSVLEVKFHSEQHAIIFKKHFPATTQNHLTFLCSADDLDVLQQDILQIILDNHLSIQSITKQQSTLDDVFLEVTSS